MLKIFRIITVNLQHPPRMLLQKQNCINSVATPTTRNMCKFREKTTDASIPELKEELKKAMGVEEGYKTIPPSRTHLLHHLPKSQAELPPRSMNDSFIASIIPLSKDKKLQERYVSLMGRVRIGRLLEDMDIFAVMVALKHIHLPKLGEAVFPYTLVTVLVDKIDFTDYFPSPLQDIRVSGHVSWVGRSSIEVVVWLEQMGEGKWRRLTRALFLMAARDPTNTKAALVNAIKPATDREREILAGGEERKKRRVQVQKGHLSKVVPNDEEQKVIHDLYVRTINLDGVSLKNRILPHSAVWMSDCTLSNLIFSHPEDRNLHNTVFGGFIMRHAAELSWALAFLFSKYRPQLRSISDISFNKPIPMSSLIQMEAHVVYTQMQYIQITVYAQVRESTSGTSLTTNTFHFTYEVPQQVPELFPSTYHEAMMYIDGRRHFINVITEREKVLNSDDVFLTSKL